MIVNVYIDGFNFYYGCFKNQTDAEYASLQKLKWVDLRKLSELLRPTDTIKRIHYCTARVNATLRDPDQPVRQEIYLNALHTLAGMKIHFGSFRPRPKYGMLIGPPGIVKQLGPQSRLVQIMGNEEKGSDVNIATHLLRDAFTGDCDAALVITNDSDLVEAVRTARIVAGIETYIVSPSQTVTKTLRKAATSAATLHESVVNSTGAFRTKAELLADSQFPSPIILKNGLTIDKPRTW